MMYTNLPLTFSLLERPQMISNFSSHIADQWHDLSRKFKDIQWEALFALIDPMDLCHMFLRLLVTMKDKGVLLDAAIEMELRGLFKKVCRGLQVLATTPLGSQSHTETAIHCLGLIAALDITLMPKGRIRHSRTGESHRREKHVLGSLIEVIQTFTPPNEAFTSETVVDASKTDATTRISEL